VWGKALAACKPPRWDEAEAQMAESLRLLESGQALMETARTHLAWGAICCDRSDGISARHHWEQAAAQWEKSNIPWEMEQTQALIDFLDKRQG